MSDSTWEAVKEKITSDIVNPLTKDGETLTVGDVTLVDTDSPVNITKFAKTIFGTIIALFALGASAIQSAVLNGFEGYPRAIGSFTSDLVTAIFNFPSGLLETAAATTAAEATDFGVFAFVLGVGAVLASLYVVSIGVNRLG